MFNSIFLAKSLGLTSVLGLASAVVFLCFQEELKGERIFSSLVVKTSATPSGPVLTSLQSKPATQLKYFCKSKGALDTSCKIFKIKETPQKNYIRFSDVLASGKGNKTITHNDLSATPAYYKIVVARAFMKTIAWNAFQEIEIYSGSKNTDTQNKLFTVKVVFGFNHQKFFGNADLYIAPLTKLKGNLTASKSATAPASAPQAQALPKSADSYKCAFKPKPSDDDLYDCHLSKMTELQNFEIESADGTTHKAWEFPKTKATEGVADFTPQDFYIIQFTDTKTGKKIDLVNGNVGPLYVFKYENNQASLENYAVFKTLLPTILTTPTWENSSAFVLN